jgi:hypothetical protein
MARLETLHERMRAVYIGGRFVSEIPQSEWLYILAQVDRNQELWHAQLRNLLRVGARVLGFAFISVPLGVFWTAAVLGWLGKPIALGGPEAHVGALLARPELVAAGVAMAVGSMLALGFRLGYVNFFSKARSALLKAHLDLDEPGDCSLR